MRTASFEWREAPAAQFAVIGDPIVHSKSPAMHGAWFKAAGLAYRYIAVRVPGHEFGIALDRMIELGFLGLNVTVPLKERAFTWVESADPAASEIGAVNCIDLVSRHGRNTDAPAFGATLRKLGLSSNARTLLIGAGGSAAAVAYACRSAGFALDIWNRTRERAEALADRFDARVKDGSPISLDGYDLIVNATSGVSDVNLAIEWGGAKHDAVAYDLMYGRTTPFMSAAQMHGLAVIDGTDMLVEQGALSLEGWLGTKVDRSILRQALNGALA